MYKRGARAVLTWQPWTRAPGDREARGGSKGKVASSAPTTVLVVVLAMALLRPASASQQFPRPERQASLSPRADQTLAPPMHLIAAEAGSAGGVWIPQGPGPIRGGVEREE